MDDIRPIALEGEQKITLGVITRNGEDITVEYEGIDGPDAVTVPAGMTDNAIRLTIHHREWMKKYPPDA